MQGITEADIESATMKRTAETVKEHQARPSDNKKGKRKSRSLEKL